MLRRVRRGRAKEIAGNLFVLCLAIWGLINIYEYVADGAIYRMMRHGGRWIEVRDHGVEALFWLGLYAIFPLALAAWPILRLLERRTRRAAAARALVDGIHSPPAARSLDER